MSEANRIVRATLDSLSAHIALVDASGEIFMTNEAWRGFAQANGTLTHEVSEGAHYLDICDAAGRAGVEEAAVFAEGLRSVLDGGLREFAMEYPCHSPTEERWFVARATRFLAGDDGLEGAVVAHEDITERKLAEEATAHLALHDPLTDLPNRRLLRDRLGQALSHAERDGSAVAVLYLDLEGFKAVNDSLGHEAGDRVLVGVAERLKRCIRPQDTAARLGGDEFTVLLEELADAGDATRIAERISQSLTSPFDLGETTASVRSSIGISLGGPDVEDPADLLRLADLAMYQAKTEGKARYRVFGREDV
ncbi:MAG: GGDEF domain-containing protein [Actinomycetota bacterium]|nr:GGDEF domain-containing protein [Actinomycetota bacterium]